MKSFGVFMIVLSLTHFSQSYTLYGSGGSNSNGNKRYNSRGTVVEPQISSAVYNPPYYQQQPQAASSFYYDDAPSMSQNYLRAPQQQQLQQPQYLQFSSHASPSRGVGVLSDEYSGSDRNSNPSTYYYYPRQSDYQPPLYGVPTYRGEYQPKPYYFAQPSYSSTDDQLETTNPLDYLHEEILQENERERSLNNAAFMQNLALYNKHVDSLKERQQQIQQMQDMFNLRTDESDDYNLSDMPSDWFDDTSIVVDPQTFESIRSNYDYPSADTQHQQRSPSQQQTIDYSEDEMVKELRGLSKQNHRKSTTTLPRFKNEYSWQSNSDNLLDAPVGDDYEEDDDTWINWSHKRSIQPKKAIDNIVKVPSKQQTKNNKNGAKKPTAMTTMSTISTSTSMENSKLLSKLGGQKEVVLPRPATPVRKPFSDSVLMAAAAANNYVKSSERSPSPIYKTIKQIIDMEQNLSHLSNNELPTSKIRKRFVTNEEALVQQLNGLKRTSKFK